MLLMLDCLGVQTPPACGPAIQQLALLTAAATQLEKMSCPLKLSVLVERAVASLNIQLKRHCIERCPLLCFHPGSPSILVRLHTSLDSADWPKPLVVTQGDGLGVAMSNLCELQFVRHVELGAPKERAEALWVLQEMGSLITKKFEFHFTGNRETNRVDRPEWLLSYCTNLVRGVHEGRNDCKNSFEIFVTVVMQIRDHAAMLIRQLQPMLEQLGRFEYDVLAEWMAQIMALAKQKLTRDAHTLLLGDSADTG